MDGSVTDMSLIISGLLEHGAENFGDTEVVTREVDGSIQRYGYADANVRAKRLASTLARRGVGAASRVATLAWNTRRHFEMFYAAPGIGALLHTVNPRLSAEHLVYIINDARDEYLFVDPQTITMAEQIAAQLWSVHTYVFMGEKNEMPTTTLPNLLNYEALVAEGDAAFEWPDLDERTPAVVCYTSGTTGQPKGVVYTHRSIVLQSFMGNMFNLPGTTNGERQVLLALAPMFHATAWNFPFIGPLIGAKIVFPGRNMEPEKIYELLEQEQVTRAGGVPSIWVILTDWMEANGKQFSSLKHAIGAGSTVSQSVIQSLLDKGLEVYQTWGMTEIPHASSGLLKPGHDQLSSAEQLRYRSKSGRAIYGMRLKLVDDAGKTLPRDGVTAGHLRVKGLWAAASYLNKPEVQALDEQGWMITGDIATIDQHGYMQLVDRSKDVIKSGGEWISSVELEKAALGHPEVAQAAVIAVPHRKWLERPLLLVVRREGASVDAASLLAFMRPLIARWWLPDAVEFVDSLPMTGVGKLDKRSLRAAYADYRLNDAAQPKDAAR